MRALKVLNSIAIGIPIVFLLIATVDESFLFYAALSTMVTGFIQLLTGFYYWSEYSESKAIKMYFFFVALFFVLLTTPIPIEWFVILPPALCIYLSYLVYSLQSES
ncbi:hypothetical protein [Flavobacterium sp.]|uniref:hypothetical protein n=1 Tax=Flavobacterium sp. TaxID=239 RepID=UPI002B4B0FF8|nr:hypothetical protein [Flavobacterium sp.]HLP64991.1 hypothetical protein [Flavobacterium sp.]